MNRKDEDSHVLTKQEQPKELILHHLLGACPASSKDFVESSRFRPENKFAFGFIICDYLKYDEGRGRHTINDSNISSLEARYIRSLKDVGQLTW